MDNKIIVKKKKVSYKRLLYNLLFFACLSVFVYSAYNVGKDYYGSYVAKKQQLEQKDKFLIDALPTDVLKVVDSVGKKATNVNNSDLENTNKALKKSLNFDSMFDINNDSIGWIEIPKTYLSEPLVQTTNNDYYLWRNFYKERYPTTGTIFLDYQNNNSLSDRISYIYGHYMWDSSKFTILKNFFDDDFFNNHRYINIYTKNGVLTYKTIGISMLDESTDLYAPLEYNDDNNFDIFVENIKSISKDTDLEIKKDDKFLALVTCETPRPNENRRVLFAKLVVSYDKKH